MRRIVWTAVLSLWLAACGGGGSGSSTGSGLAADVSVTAIAVTSRVLSGGWATYTMTVRNASAVDAREVSLQSLVDPAQTLGPISCRAYNGAVCPFTGASMLVTRLPGGGRLDFSVAAKVAPTATGTISASMTASTVGDPLASNDAAVATTVVVAGGLTTVTLQSEPFEFIGRGRNYAYTRKDAAISIQTSENRAIVRVTGDEYWTGLFQMPSSAVRLEPGTYSSVQPSSSPDPLVGGMEWSGEGGLCGISTSVLVVERVVYAGDALQALDLHFEQRCQNQQQPALRGQVHWDVSDNSEPPGPANPPPADLWRPTAGVTPATGNYVYLVGEAITGLTGVNTATYTETNSILQIFASGSDGGLHVNITGTEIWTGEFRAMSSIARPAPGYYPNVRAFPSNPAKGRVSWPGHGSCPSLGWFVIDHIAYDGSQLSALDLRFELGCEGYEPVFRGQIHWVAADATGPPGPQVPPADLWQPSAGATPASGNYVYLQSDAGDRVGNGASHLYRPPADTIAVFGGNRGAQVRVGEPVVWTGNFQAMSSLDRLVPGYYSGLQHMTVNPALGGLYWQREGVFCAALTGWFVVDSVSYHFDTMTALELRFEQHCDGAAPALRGKVRWVSGF